MNKYWNAFLDFASRWLQPALGFVALVSGTLISVDYSDLRAIFPKWIGLFDVLEGSFLFWVFLISATLSVIIGFALARRERTMRELKDTIRQHRSEIDEIGNNIIILFDGLLLNLGRRLGLQQGAQVRISLYVHDKSRKRFIPCGRYSPNPTLMGPGRTSYPDNEGCVSEGWKRGWHFDNQVPPSGAPRKTYNRSTYNIPEATNASIRMLSTLYAVKRLDDALGQAVAVLVVEAVESAQFADDRLHEILEGVADDFARMVHTLKSYIPNPASAAESGL